MAKRRALDGMVSGIRSGILVDGFAPSVRESGSRGIDKVVRIVAGSTRFGKGIDFGNILVRNVEIENVEIFFDAGGGYRFR